MEMSSQNRDRIRVRFAPDSRAKLNVAGARIALVNWLFARSEGGSLALRLEDRYGSKAPEQAFRGLAADLRWLGLDWDEGPDVGGEFGPYLQSERLGIYQSYLERLIDGDHVYECYCTPQELAAVHREARRQGRTPCYSGRCRTMDENQRQESRASGLKPAVRFKGPLEHHTRVEDMRRGVMFLSNRQLDDFVIMRPDGVFTYNFCCVVDDILMSISHVIRGEEHLSNTPRQLWLYEALEHEPPVFLHLGRLTEPDGSKLRRGRGSSTVEELRRRGLMSHVLVSFLAGLDRIDTTDFTGMADLATRFAPDRVRRGAVALDRRQLFKLNARYLRSLPEEQLAALVLPRLEDAGLWPSQGRDEAWLRRSVGLLRDEMVLLEDIIHHLTPLLDPSPPIDGRRLDQMVDTVGAAHVLKAWAENLSDMGRVEEWDLREVAQRIRRELGLSVKDVFMPFRVAVTGRTRGPDLMAIARQVGREQVIERLLEAHRQLV